MLDKLIVSNEFTCKDIQYRIGEKLTYPIVQAITTICIPHLEQIKTICLNALKELAHCYYESVDNGNLDCLKRVSTKSCDEVEEIYKNLPIEFNEEKWTKDKQETIENAQKEVWMLPELEEKKNSCIQTLKDQAHCQIWHHTQEEIEEIKELNLLLTQTKRECKRKMDEEFCAQMVALGFALNFPYQISGKCLTKIAKSSRINCLFTSCQYLSLDSCNQIDKISKKLLPKFEQEWKEKKRIETTAKTLYVGKDRKEILYKGKQPTSRPTFSQRFEDRG